MRMNKFVTAAVALVAVTSFQSVYAAEASSGLATLESSINTGVAHPAMQHSEYRNKDLDEINHHLNDYHETSVDFMQLPDEMTPYPHFLVEVNRHDILTDVKDGESDSEQVVAQKLTHIVLAFDVSPKNKDVTVNGVPVPMGISHLSIEADKLQLLKKPQAIAQDGAGKKIDMSKEQLMDAMDRGVIGISLNVEAETVAIADGVQVQRFKIAELITEVNGVEVEQHRLMQQILEVNVDGQVRTRMVKPSIEAVRKLQSLNESPMSKLAAKTAGYVHRMSVVTSVFVCIAMGFATFAIIFAGAWLLNFLIVRRQNLNSYGRIALTDEEELYRDEKLPVYDEASMEQARERTAEKQLLSTDN